MNLTLGHVEIQDSEIVSRVQLCPHQKEEVEAKGDQITKDERVPELQF